MAQEEECLHKCKKLKGIRRYYFTGDQKSHQYKYCPWCREKLKYTPLKDLKVREYIASRKKIMKVYPNGMSKEEYRKMRRKERRQRRKELRRLGKL